MKNKPLKIFYFIIVFTLISTAVFSQKKFTLKTLVPGAVQISNGQKGKGWSIICSEAITLASGGLFWYLSDKEYDKYMELPLGTTQDEFDKHFNNSEKYGTIAICSFAAAGAVYLYSVIDAICIAEPAGGSTSLYVLPEKGGFSFCFKLKF